MPTGARDPTQQIAAAMSNNFLFIGLPLPAQRSRFVPPLHADVPYPVGDARPLAGLAVSPDLVHGTADVRSGSITFSIRLAPGTFDPSTTLVIIALDTDQSAATGRSDSDLGVDYLLSLGSGFGS